MPKPGWRIRRNRLINPEGDITQCKGADLEMSVRITKYEQAFELICVPYNDKARQVIRFLEKEGHTEKSICYSVWRGHENLLKIRRDKERFWGAFVNTVRKWSWPKGDPRWDAYWKRKNEEKKAGELERKLLEEEARKFAEEKAYKMRYPGFIYFIQGESGGPIKIGYTRDLKGRLNSLQTGYPDVLILLGAFPGNQDDEQRLHEEFSGCRIRGEWFRPVEQILEKIKNLKTLEV